MSRPDFLSPVVLTQQMPAWSVDANQVDLYPPSGFMNPNKTPMILDQLRFWYDPTPFEVAGAFDFGKVMEEFQKCDVKMSLGGIPLTNDWVPAPVVFPFFAGFMVNKTSFGPVVRQEDVVFTWHLDKALLIPPRVQFQVDFRRANQTGLAGYPFGIHGMTLAGRSTSDAFKMPNSIQVPWICGFRASIVTTVETYLSTPNQLANPHCETVNITRVCGTDLPADPNTTVQNDNTVQMTLSTNKAFIRDAVPFRLLLPPERGMLQMNAKLEQHEHIVCELQAGNGNANGLKNVSIGFHGYREIETPSGF